jgi:hypothetical protein
LRALETKLRRRFGTNVKVVQSSGTDKGQIQIEFYGLNDLNRIYELLMASDGT